MAKVSTQKYLDIAEIREDTVILKNGSLRAVLLASSINFSLKSEEEQTAIISAYAQFLNTLELPVQIVIQSRPFDIKPYLSRLERLREEQTNELLKAQMADYIDFVKELVEMGEIMSKKFYVAVGYNPAGDLKRGFLDRLFDVFKTVGRVTFSKARFKKHRERLFREMDKVISNLNAMGVKSVPLDTQSLIELFYKTYNQETSRQQDLAKKEELKIEE